MTIVLYVISISDGQFYKIHNFFMIHELIKVRIKFAPAGSTCFDHRLDSFDNRAGIGQVGGPQRWDVEH